MANKWGSDYWIDTAERVGTTAIYGLITMLTANATGTVSGDATQWWVIVGLPTALSLLKCLLTNLQGGAPTASLIHVNSTNQPRPEGGAIDLAIIYYVLGIIFFVLATLWLLGADTRSVFG
jgi:hypothetical protein